MIWFVCGLQTRSIGDGGSNGLRLFGMCGIGKSVDLVKLLLLLYHFGPRSLLNEIETKRSAIKQMPTIFHVEKMENKMK